MVSFSRQSQLIRIQYLNIILDFLKFQMFVHKLLFFCFFKPSYNPFLGPGLEQMWRQALSSLGVYLYLRTVTAHLTLNWKYSFTVLHQHFPLHAGMPRAGAAAFTALAHSMWRFPQSIRMGGHTVASAARLLESFLLSDCLDSRPQFNTPSAHPRCSPLTWPSAPPGLCSTLCSLYPKLYLYTGR